VELNKPLGKIMLCMPISSFQPIRQKLAGGYLDDDAKVDENWIRCIRDRLMPIQVDMKVDLGRTTLSVKDLQNLRPGDIIVLDNNFRDPVRAAVEGVPKYEGYVGRVKNRKVFRVEQPVAAGP
jgi:flagellar motor switch protein FliM